MTFTQAEYKLKAFMRDMGFVGELPHPNEEVSESNSNGFWLLKTITGSHIAIVSEDSEVELLWVREN